MGHHLADDSNENATARIGRVAAFLKDLEYFESGYLAARVAAKLITQFRSKA